ncbi:Asp23/Gls24 family envelope stress response protein OS=Tsukamurella paurometabola (strain ATCC 8368/ DSM / CCUG 35730 / CIP 100753 / JCM 10117 / KCTC 9821/ NBRC 16120 / NCIMB 702349 / NCTC 13040) OX=521096 GN=Tpau_0289 PE=4 SV=1 [Tsukamurella paurometabola]|uniref:Asp23/Gls24 family envelope stress response protein n=1 Tax=Tsukamurella paurometabola (strain ATCC 8368 / DSM 20162 / CCUG 35730 / CIP 100753 / JCM 10117 / KCTC 9821 / NBRC 16120 / NCIMB 702349 / NCTC 13040) TaxID=521096 RepID=D5UQV3_TSUPD|nr:hypothetical protein [Tsukamurella paurometabola]ADG76936.1 hypothetical protein Tpau_0289 [Tsukamurella paurometabola DSM 20162]
MSNNRAVLVDRVVEVVTAINGVAGLHAGGTGAPATYLPGRTITGIRFDGRRGQVDIVAEYRRDSDLRALAERVGEAATESAGVPVDVVVADIVPPSKPDYGNGVSPKE